MLNNNIRNSTRFEFIAAHRGGPLSVEDHKKLIGWAIDCAEHILFLAGPELEIRLAVALNTAKEWKRGITKTGMAMKAAQSAHAAARETTGNLEKAVARAMGQMVATAHMADHALGAAYYALKAVKQAGMDVQKEKDWQLCRLNKLPANIITAVNNMWLNKDLDNRI